MVPRASVRFQPVPVARAGVAPPGRSRSASARPLLSGVRRLLSGPLRGSALVLPSRGLVTGPASAFPLSRRCSPGRPRRVGAGPYGQPIVLLGARCSVLGAGCWVLGAGCWVLGARCPAPRRSAAPPLRRVLCACGACLRFLLGGASRASACRCLRDIRSRRPNWMRHRPAHCIADFALVARTPQRVGG
jgi:hypothetical protein